jgi:hypothetical protein
LGGGTEDLCVCVGGEHVCPLLHQLRRWDDWVCHFLMGVCNFVPLWG